MFVPSNVRSDVHLPLLSPSLPFLLGYRPLLFRPLLPVTYSLAASPPYLYPSTSHKSVCLTARGPGSAQDSPSGSGQSLAAKRAFGASQFKICAFGVAIHSLFGNRSPNHHSIFGGDKVTGVTTYNQPKPWGAHVSIPVPNRLYTSPYRIGLEYIKKRVKAITTMRVVRF